MGIVSIQARPQSDEPVAAEALLLSVDTLDASGEPSDL